MGKSHLAPFWTIKLGTGVCLAANLVVHVAAIATLLGGFDAALSNVRVFGLVASAVVLIIDVFLLIARHNEVRSTFASGSVPSFNLDVEYAGYWIGTVIYASLTVTLAILHFREPAANAFDPLVNPGAYSRLIIVVGAYYGLSLVWIITSIFVHLTVKGADIRRRLVGLDAATKV